MLPAAVIRHRLHRIFIPRRVSISGCIVCASALLSHLPDDMSPSNIHTLVLAHVVCAAQMPRHGPQNLARAQCSGSGPTKRPGRTRPHSRDKLPYRTPANPTCSPVSLVLSHARPIYSHSSHPRTARKTLSSWPAWQPWAPATTTATATTELGFVARPRRVGSHERSSSASASACIPPVVHPAGSKPFLVVASAAPSARWLERPLASRARSRAGCSRTSPESLLKSILC